MVVQTLSDLEQPPFLGLAKTKAIQQHQVPSRRRPEFNTPQYALRNRKIFPGPARKEDEPRLLLLFQVTHDVSC